MAVDQHITSRRAFIGALAAVPILRAQGVVNAAATGGVSKRGNVMNAQENVFDISPVIRWEAAVGEHRRLRAEWTAHPYGRTLPNSPDYERLEAEEELIADRSAQALKTLLRTASPDLTALVEKMELFGEEFGEVLGGEFTCLVNDARRLAGG